MATDERRSDFQPNFETVAKIVTAVAQTANEVERCVRDVLDKQMVHRLLSQYDHLIRAGFQHQEALDAVTDLVRRRIETAIEQRAQAQEESQE